MSFGLSVLLIGFRLKLSPHLRESQALIIFDGHTSRENPLAMALFRKARVNVLCLPSHTTHVLQIFDVSLASPLKRFFGTAFKKELKKATQDQQLRTNAAKYRFSCIIAFVTAWKAAATPVNALAGAKCTGIYPLDPNAPRNSMFVRNLTPKEE